MHRTPRALRAKTPPPGSEPFESSANTAETTAINTGLLYLGNVLRELAEAGKRGERGAGVNFNNHNLTRFLEVLPRGAGGAKPRSALLHPACVLSACLLDCVLDC